MYVDYTDLNKYYPKDPFGLPQIDKVIHSTTGYELLSFLGWSFTILLLWTLAPYDYVIYCQALGLSGHTSPHGECAGFFLEDYMPIEED